MKLLVKLLSIPLDSLSIQVLRMETYPQLMGYMKFSNKRQVALRICKAVIKEGKTIQSYTTTDQLLGFITPLLQDDENGGKEESYEFEEGQESVARLVGLVWHTWSNDIYYELLLKFKKVLVKGGIKRMKYTIPALVFSVIRLTQTINLRELHPVPPQDLAPGEPQPQVQVNQKRLFKLVAELLQMIQAAYPELTLRLNLQAV
jgi:hypothetical protein